MINSFNVFVISLYKARCWPDARIDANRGKRSYEWKMDTLVRQNKRKEKVKGAEKRFEEMHASWKAAERVEPTPIACIDFPSLYLGTIDNRFWPRLLFVNFLLLSSTVRISILDGIDPSSLFTRCWDGVVYSRGNRDKLWKKFCRFLQGIILT